MVGYRSLPTDQLLYHQPVLYNLERPTIVEGISTAPTRERGEKKKKRGVKLTNLPIHLVIRNSHIQRTSTISEILGSQDSALLTNQERSRVRVAADIVGTDGQVGDLEVRGAVHVQAFVDDTVFDD